MSLKKVNKGSTAKSLGPKEASFILDLYESDKAIFTLDDACRFTGLVGQSLRNFLHRLTKKSILTNLCNGLYIIVPFELGRERIYAGNPLVIARELVKKKTRDSAPMYYISHGSAMELHRMVTQPQLTVCCSVVKQIRQVPHILGTEFRFITVKEKDFFGTKKIWVTNSSEIMVSDVERTIIDGLKVPAYCGGLTEVAKAFWIRRDDMSMSRLVDYAISLGVGAVYRRLGYLLEVYQMDCPLELERLQQRLTRSYSLLDPTLLHEGVYSSKWKLIINISEDEFQSIIRT